MKSKENSNSFSEIEKKVIFELGGDLGRGPRPFADLGRKVGLSEDEVIALIQKMKADGVLRRFGATLRHQRSGFKANAMVAWRVAPDRVDEVGSALASFPEVTHCYRRRTAPGWEKNLYTMLHASSEEELTALALRLSEAAGVSDFELLFSHEELKKTSMRYFE
ncbi:MAG: Lrp/AsnC family transcriptional regulator [Pseudomonadota bacterium]